MAKDDIEIVVSGEANESKANSLVKKYKQMADMRRDYEDIDIKDCIPTLDEMVQDDLMYEILENAANGKTEDEVLSTAFYVDEPKTQVLGYNNELNTFNYKVSALDIKDSDIGLNKIDGDTFYVPLNSIIEPGERGFTMNNGESYDSFKDYCYSNGLVNESDPADKQNVQIRLIGIDAPEIPHYEIQMMKESDIVSMTLSEAKKKNSVIEKYNWDGTTATERTDNGKKIDFYKVKDSTGNYTYYEIKGNDPGYVKDKKSGYVYKKIVTSDESQLNTLAGGYKAQQNMIDLLSAGNIQFMLDANGIKATKTSSKYKLYYNHWWNAGETIKDMIDQWCDYSSVTAITRLSYSPYGTDGYGRFIGAAYVPKDGVSVNVAKYNIADDETHSIANPDFSGSPELGNLGGDNAAAFELYNYEKNNQIWLDSFSEMTKKSYQGRIEFHKEVTGIDFTKVRNCTMFIGDTLLLIPPENIRSLSNIEYEKVNIMRGKGSMVKNNTNRDMFLEVDLYFYNGSGINGINKDVELPNGDEVTYFVDGLRSLIAQFKVAPYLPIENQFINDVLGIEAVSLINLTMSTVEGIPRLLRATLTMRDFNYRIYMPDIPIDYSSNQVSEIAEMNPIFAKCFNWEVFRFYYQRMISYGDHLKEIEAKSGYNSLEYKKEFYSKKEILQPVYFCEKDGFGASDISFYTPDENWLKAALSIKKDKEYYGQNPVGTELTDAGKDFFEKVGGISDNLKVNTTHAKSMANKCEVVLKTPSLSGKIEKKGILADRVSTEGSVVRAKNSTANKKNGYLSNLIMDVVDKVEASGALSYYDTDEIYDTNNKTLTWKIKFTLSNELTDEDLLYIRENLKDGTGKSFNDVLSANRLIVELSTDVTNGKTIGENVSLYCPEINAMADYNSGIDSTADVSAYDYLNPACMQFLPYLENVELQSLTFSLTNNFSDITLKIMDGFAPQYMGSSDITIEASLITTSEVVVSMLNVLPAHAANIGKLYRKILSCWPIKIRNHYLQMVGVNEVLIDLVEVQTVHGYPGTYEVRMKMTSVDRTMRQRETLKQLESDEKSSTKAAASMYSYWDFEKVLSTAELYPDLDLPSIKELNQYGFQFIRYKNSKQAYPDPDFYLNYSWPYTSYIIKKNLKDVFYNSVFHDEGKDKSDILDDTAYQFFDQMGMYMYQKLDPVEGLTPTNGEGDKDQNDYADLFDEAMNIIDEGAMEDVKKTDKEMARELAERDCVNLAETLIYLTACDVQQGWTIKPGLVAPVVVSELNADVEKLYCSGIEQEEVTVDEMHNAYAEDVFDLRAELIKAIDDYLSDPIDYVRYNVVSSTTVGVDGKEYTASYGDVINQVVSLFSLEEKGQKILQLLNPFEDEFGTNDDVGIKDDRNASEDANRENGQLAPSDEMDYNAPNTMEALTGFLYAAAKCISGKKMADPEKDSKTIWEPTQFSLDSHGKVIKDSAGNMVPHCQIEIKGKPLDFADTLDEALNQGVRWGMFQIKMYRPSELQRILKPTSRVTYLPKEEMPMYKDPETGKERWHAGFIDPYYNIAGYRSQVGKEYIKMIATNEGVNTIAFIRELLMHMRRMVIDGLLISEIDVVAKDYSEMSATILDEHVTTLESLKGAFKKMLEVGGDILTLPLDLVNAMFGSPIEGMANLFEDLFVDNTVGYLDDSWDMTQLESLEDATGGDADFAGMVKELVESLPETYDRSFCARLVLPTVSAMTENDPVFNDILVKYQLSELNNLTLGAITSSGSTLSRIALFCQALESIGFLDYSKVETDPETTSDSQKLWNYIMREAYTKLADDPQAFTLHSYYDMLINDKRGRMVRAFPTYYAVFVDEGRRIGSWKLFDNFYNMSAISEITVSKSRKIPADTCSFVMSNMYSSYAASYDNTTRQQYVDIYGLRDVFDSIFSPKSYFIKEDSLRRRKENLETTVLQPGVRIHIRMGYGSDAARLPVAFNGKIAEIDVGEVVQVIAQGDGIELSNPLNTLGEIDAVSLEEAQDFTTLFKDIRGSMSRGGESPRNLLCKLLTAKYGGVLKTAFRMVSNDRWYGDNPFGIYHFGDNRFNTIFAEGETVQNLYEVCDATLLKGSNELYAVRENTMATPTINTTLQDKTFWDVLHLCANSGIGYMGAIRDFGMRSTVCLCKPNHYYAFGYKIIDDEEGQTEGKIVERRKPFQQFHYYDAYTDIVYNSIKASEKNMKTNATGIWESTDMIWGKSQSTVGPIYLDFNIYPEYQRSMTVDTTLVSDGIGGLELNAITHFSEQWASDANDNKVNKALAERVTTNVLRESVSNMYCGELCVLGDTSIKPYDRFYVNDLYEDMQGHMEVEAVVYSMNAATGFTTTIYPDTIVRMNEDRTEAAKRLVDASLIGSLGISVTGRLLGINTFARLDTTLLRALQKGVAALSAVGGATAGGAVAGGAAAAAGATATGTSMTGALTKFLSSSGKLATLKEAGISALTTGMSLTAVASTVVIAAGIYICTNNVKSWFGSFLKNIQALSVYPIYKNQRPLIAGMAGHKGSVRGYEYTKDDADDSIQGLILNSVEWLNKGNDKFEKVFPFEFGDILMNMFTRSLTDENGNKISEYELVREQWKKSLPLEESNDSIYLDEEGKMSEEEFLQMLYGSTTTELNARKMAIPALRTKWRIPSLLVSDTDRLADNVYKKYHIDGVSSFNDLSSNDKLLALHPIEDEPDIKQALIKGTHEVVKELQIGHAIGNAKVQMPFESGNRIIKFFAMPGESDEGYIYDMPLLQEDALLVLKLILNDQALRNKTVMFMSGARVNDKKTWKSTGFAFVINSSDQTALEDAIKSTLELTKTLNKDKTPIFEYKTDAEGFLIIVYAPVDIYTSNASKNNEEENKEG